MDRRSFDDLARLPADGRTRRGALRTAAGGNVAWANSPATCRTTRDGDQQACFAACNAQRTDCRSTCSGGSA